MICEEVFLFLPHGAKKEKLTRLGFSNAKIARHLVMDARTVTRYQNMDEEEYQRYLLKSSNRKKIFICLREFCYR